MPLTLPSSSRRRDVRRLWRQPEALLRWLWGKRLWWVALYVAAFGIGGAVLALGTFGRPREAVDQIAVRPVVARVAFQIVDEAKWQKDRREARDSQPPVYRASAAYLKQVRDGLANLGQLGADKTRTLDKATGVPALDAAGLEALRRFYPDPQSDLKADPTWDKLSEQFLAELFGIAVLDATAQELQPLRKVVIQHPTLNQEIERYSSVILSAADDSKAVKEKIAALVDRLFPAALRASVLASAAPQSPASAAAEPAAAPSPFYERDSQETERRKQAAFDGAPKPYLAYKPGDLLAAPGKRLTLADVRAVEEEHRQFEQQMSPADRWTQRAGLAGLIGLIGLGLWSYITLYNPRIAQNPTRGLALTATLLLCQGLAVAGASADPRHLIFWTGIPTLFAAIVLAIAYDRRFALLAGSVEVLLVTVSLDVSIGFGLVLLVGVAVASGQLDDVRTRSKLLWVGLWTGVAMGAAAFLVGLTERAPLLHPGSESVFRNALLGLVVGSMTGLVVQGILPAIEQIFKVTTAMTLKEMNDVSHPLLRRLAQEAPGTYQHALRLADLCEAAAEAIGANALLCKVGAMYHDIGKISKPAYFVENQAGGPNRHDRLAPAMSLLIIVGHVKDGIELAREYKLPPALRQFIDSHHGTTLVEYFYHAAKKQSDQQNLPAPAEFEFRYPGPRPQTREAAILMLCDSIESAARTVAEPTRGNLEQLVHAIATKRLADGQFDQSNLTLAELHRIEQTLVNVLSAAYHGRIAYPGDKGMPERRGPVTAAS